MNQGTARHGPRGKSGDEDVAGLTARRPEHRQEPEREHGQDQERTQQDPAREQAEEPGRPSGAGALGPDDPDQDEAGPVGGDDLSDIDLGPAAPGFRDPDAGSGRIRK